MICSLVETMAEEEKERKPGWVHLGDEAWATHDVAVGCIMEFVTAGLELPANPEIHGALLVTACEPRDDKGLLVRGRLVGGEDADVTNQLSNLINRRSYPLHLCGGEPCPLADSTDMVHLRAVTCWERDAFQASYLKPWGKMVIKEYGEKGEIPKKKRKKPEAKPKAGPGKAKDGKKPRGGREVKAKKRPAKAKEPEGGDPAGTAALRKKLQDLKRREAGARARKEEKEAGEEESLELQEVESVDSSAADSSPVAETPALDTGTQLARPHQLLALTNGPEVPDGSWMKAMGGKKAERKKVRGEAEAQLLALAAQKSKEQEAERHRSKKEKKRGRRKRKEKDLEKDPPKKGKKKKKKKKKKRKDGGGSSSPSSESDGSGSSSEETASSTSSSLLAPLQKKSKQDPGGVLRLLLKHAKQLMDQDASVDTSEATGILGGVRMTSYFSLFLRPYYSSASRDMKELFLLATAIDELRQGRLGTLGDSLASRFIAIQTAMSDGSWKSAQFLEMHPLENNGPAPMPLLLQARKHARVVDRSLRVDEGGRRGNWRNQETRGYWQNEEKGKGKGGKGKDSGKKGKGKGRNSWGSGYQGGGWNSWGNQNSDQEWWNKKKDGKDGDKKKETEKKE